MSFLSQSEDAKQKRRLQMERIMRDEIEIYQSTFTQEGPFFTEMQNFEGWKTYKLDLSKYNRARDQVIREQYMEVIEKQNERIAYFLERLTLIGMANINGKALNLEDVIKMQTAKEVFNMFFSKEHEEQYKCRLGNASFLDIDDHQIDKIREQIKEKYGIEL